MNKLQYCVVVADSRTVLTGLLLPGNVPVSFIYLCIIWTHKSFNQVLFILEITLSNQTHFQCRRVVQTHKENISIHQRIRKRKTEDIHVKHKFCK